MSPEPSASYAMGGDNYHNHSKPPRTTSVRKTYSCLLDVSFGTLVEEDDADFELDDQSYLLNLAAAAEDLAAAEGRLTAASAEEEPAAPSAVDAAAVHDSDPELLLEDDSATDAADHHDTHHDQDKTSGSHSQGEDTAGTEEETNHDDDDEGESDEEEDDFSMRLSFGEHNQDQEVEDHEEQEDGEHEESRGRLSFLFDLLPSRKGYQADVEDELGHVSCHGFGGNRNHNCHLQRSSSSGHGGGGGGWFNRSLHGGGAGAGGGEEDALNKTIHGGACGRGGQTHHSSLSPPRQRVTSTTASTAPPQPKIGVVQKRVSDYEQKRASWGGSSNAAAAAAARDCSRRGRESHPSRGRPRLLSPKRVSSWSGRGSLSPTRGSWGGASALSPVRRGMSPLRRPLAGSGSPGSTTSSRGSKNSYAPRGSGLGDFLAGNRGSSTTIPLDLDDLDVWGDDDVSVGASFRTFNTMNMDQSACDFQRNISGSAFAVRGRYTGDEGGITTINETNDGAGAGNEKISTTKPTGAGRRINAFVENQFTTFAHNIDSMQDKFEKMTTNIGETAQVIQEEPKPRVVGAVVQARLSCFAGNLQHIGKSTTNRFVCNLRTICGLQHYHNNNNDMNNNNDSDDDRLYSHQDTMY